MCAFVVSPQKILASRVPGLSPKSLAVMQSVPTGFTPAPAGFMIVTSASVPAGGTSLGDDGLDVIERGEGAAVGLGVWVFVAPPPGRFAGTTTATTTTA